MKKIISILLSIILCFSSAAVFAADEKDLTEFTGEKGLPEFIGEKSIGRCNWSAETHNTGGIAYDREGNPLMCYSTQGGFFFVIDLMTGEVKQRHKTVGGNYIMAHGIKTAANGKVYMGIYPAYTINVYDPITNTIENEYPGVEIHYQDGGTMTEDGMYYFGEYSNEGARVYQYDTNNKVLKSFGPLDENCHYVKGATADENYIYAGMGTGEENCKVIRINKKTGEQDVFVDRPGGGIVYNLQCTNGRLIVHTNGTLTIVDTSTGEKVGVVGGDAPSEPSPVDKNLIYFCSGNIIYELNVQSLEKRKVCESPFTSDEKTKFTQWAELINGEYVLAFRTGFMGKIGYVNPKTGEVVSHKVSEIAEAGPNVQGIGVSDDGIIYVGGYQTSMGAYNIKTGEYLYSVPLWHQNEGTGFLNGKTYFGTYTDAVMFRYDPERPFVYTENYNYDNVYRGYDANPSMTYDIEDGQDRPFVVKGYKDKLYVGTLSGYNQMGGALTIIEEEDGVNPPKAEVYRNIIPNHSITGIAFKDNLVYVSSTARNGLGGPELEDKEAKIAVFDTEKKEVIETITPDLPGIGTSSKTIGEISFGPDGLLWGCSEKNGLVFALNPETFEVEKYVETNTGFDKGALARPIYLRWGDDGMLYTNSGWVISVINPETMERKGLTSGCSLFDLDPNGNVVYAKGGGVRMIYINQYDRLTGFLKTLEKLKQSDYTAEEWKALSEAIEEAKTFNEETDEKTIQDAIRNIKGLRDKKPYVKRENAMDIMFNGEELELDDDTTGVTRVYNGRTIIPYRVFLETLGYKVKWDVHTDTITATKEDSKLTMVMNSNIYTINGEEVEFDVPPVLLGGRHYIPVRLISEKLGYEVEWNEEENMVTINKK